MLAVMMTAAVTASSQELTITGRLRTIKPSTISLSSLDGREIASAPLSGAGEFCLKSKKITPDIYLLKIGDINKYFYLTEGHMTVKGITNNEAGLSFSGIDGHLAVNKWVPGKGSRWEKTLDPAMLDHLTPVMAAAAAFLSDIVEYGPNKMVLDRLDAQDRQTQVGRWLVNRVDSVKHTAVGAQAYDFECVDTEGKTVRLSDFRGKFVLIDFWASWCGPCRAEMKKLAPIYEEIKGPDIVFMSISLDDNEQAWRKLIDDENLPWLMLWNVEGFGKSIKEPCTLQKMYGFYTIPFITLLDREGKVLARHLRGDQVRDAIMAAKRSE